MAILPGEESRKCDQDNHAQESHSGAAKQYAPIIGVCFVSRYFIARHYLYSSGARAEHNQDWRRRGARAILAVGEIYPRRRRVGRGTRRLGNLPGRAGERFLG